MVLLLRRAALAALLVALAVPTAGALAATARIAAPGMAVEAGAGIEDLSVPALPTLDVPALELPVLPLPPRLDAPLPLALPTDGAASETASAARPVAFEPAPAEAAAATGAIWLALEHLGAARLLAALYSRVAPSRLLEHDRRERVVALVRERPGIGPKEIAAELRTGWGATSYHLDRLERAGLIVSQRVGQHRCYFLPGAVPREQQKNVGLFRADTARRVAQLVAERPGLTQSQLAATLGLSASATSKQVSRLETAALLRREPGAEGLRLFPQPALSAALAPAALS